MFERQYFLCSEVSAVGKAKMGADHICARLSHSCRLLRVEYKRESEQLAVVSKMYRVDLLPVAYAIIFQFAAKFAVYHADGRVVIDPGKAALLYKLNIIIHLLGGIGRVISEEHRDGTRRAQYFTACVFHDKIIAVRIAHEPCHGT